MSTAAELYELYKDEWQFVDQVQDCTLESADLTRIGRVRHIKAKQQLAIVHSSKPEGQFGGDIQTTTVTWVLWTETLQGYAPNQADVLTDEAGDRWTLGPTIRKQRYGTQYICDAQEFAQAGGP